MQSARWQRIQQLFAEALALAPGQRTKHLQDACGNDTALLREVQALLDQDAATGQTVEQVVRKEATAAPAAWARPHEGERFGAWQIVEHIADGGMGAVYRARRADGAFDQVAALKMLSPALMGEPARRRLEAERRILAGLNHPHIARLLDGGTTADGVPYLVMEHVDGVPIDLHCRTRSLDTAARLRLFLRVCEAVDYAHRNLVVHRDIKPSNLLVTPDGTPKLLDFGISKLLDGADAALTAADQRLFTPARASPEQITGGPITTATDVYALGVLLYELLAGCLPFEASGRSVAQSAHDVLHTEPAPPSASVARSGARQAAAGQHAQAQDTARLQRELDGDIDNIVLMALRKEPQRRYASVQALADDVRAVLAHRPVAARADSATYRTGKFLRRHRVAVAAAMLAVAAGTGMLAYHAARLQDERDRAADAQRQAEAAAMASEQSAQFLAELFADARPERARRAEVSARDLLDQGRARLAQSDSLPQHVRARLMHSLGGAYQSLSLYGEARALLEGSEAAWRQLHPAGSPELDAVRLDLALTLLTQGESVQAIALLEGLVASHARRGTVSLPRARALRSLAVALHDSRIDRPRALRLMEEAVALSARLGTSDAADHAHYLGELGDMLAVPGTYERALASVDEALALRLQHQGERHPGTVDTLQKRAGILSAMGRHEDARQELDPAITLGRQVLGEDHVRIGYMLSRLGQVLIALGRPAEAEARMREALAIMKMRLGDDNPRIVFMIENLAHAVLEQDRTGEALAMYRDSLRSVRARFGDAHPETGQSMANLAGALLQAGRPAEAVRLLEGAAALRPTGEQPSVPDLLRTADALLATGRPDRADAVLAQAAATADASLPAHHDLKADILVRKARVLRRLGRPDEAERRLAEAVAMMSAVQPAESPRLARLQSEWGESLVDVGRHEQARPLLTNALDRLTGTLGSTHSDTRAAQRRLRLLATPAPEQVMAR